MTDLAPVQLEFRNAMAHLAAAVNIVTTDGPNGRLGITVSAVCSVTDSPPTVLVCVNRRSAANQVFRDNGVVAINVLSSEQEELARHFSGQTKVAMEERFAWDIWDESVTEAPVLRDAHVALVGRIRETVEQGTHSIFLVEIEAVQVRGGSSGLVYHGRAFHTLAASAA